MAYGNTAWYGLHWKPELKWPLDESHMDRLYTQVMLTQVSLHEANAKRCEPEKQCVPWVDRFCADDRDPKIPILSRTRYREILRHIWLRGADSMQIFNPDWFPKDSARRGIVVEELEDAVAVYDEMLEYRRFLDKGETMNTDVPTMQSDGAIWSGLRVGDEAILRGFTMGEKSVTAKVPMAADGAGVEVECPPGGATYLIRREGEKWIASKP